MKATIVEAKCVGCGLCEENIPELFKIGDYVAYVRDIEIDEILAQRVIATAEDCPAEAIILSD